MPGSSNFVGELLILFGTFQTKIVYGLVASAGVALAAVYMIRFYQRSMHNRLGPNVESRDLALGPELAVLGPLVLIILALGVYPNFILQRTERGTTSKLAGHAGRAAPRGRLDPMSAAIQTLAAIKAPVIDYKGLSPLIAVTGGSVLVLLVAMFPGRFLQRVIVPLIGIGALGAAIGLSIWNWETGEQDDRGGRARRRPAGARAVADLLHLGHQRDPALAGARSPCARLARASTSGCCSARSPAWWCSPAPRT